MLKEENEFVLVSDRLQAVAKSCPNADAVICPAGRDGKGKAIYSHLTFKELDEESSILAAGLVKSGIGPGVRTVVMLKINIDFFIVTFALFKAGAVPVFIDPAMGLVNIKRCISNAAPKAFIGIPRAHIFRLLFGWGSNTIEHSLCAGRSYIFLGRKLNDLRNKLNCKDELNRIKTGRDDTAAILFTSGSTGVPKGAVYTNRIFLSQVKHIKNIFAISEGDIDVPAFPLFALFDPLLGVTALIPDIDFTKPAKADPEKIIEPIKRFKASSFFGSPVVIRRIEEYANEKGIILPSLKRAVSAGAPVPPDLQKRFCRLLSHGVPLYSPYGATESLPVCSIDSKEVVTECLTPSNDGNGVCVGRPVGDMKVVIIKIVDAPIPYWLDDIVVKDGTMGEITVMGDVVTREYFRLPDQTRLAKIPVIDEDGHIRKIYHRMGDVGYFDNKGRLWFCGRKSQRVITKKGTLFTIPVESVFNRHKDVFRTALVGVSHREKGFKVPVLCVELKKETDKKRLLSIRDELKAMGEDFTHTKDIRVFLFKRSFPVDKRHNSKIFREKLSIWADRICKKGYKYL